VNDVQTLPPDKTAPDEKATDIADARRMITEATRVLVVVRLSNETSDWGLVSVEKKYALEFLASQELTRPRSFGPRKHPIAVTLVDWIDGASCYIGEVGYVR